MVAARTHVAAQQAQIMRLETMAEKREDAAAQQKADADASIAQLRMLRTHDEKRAKRDAAALRKALKIQEDECTAMLKAQHFEKGQRGRAAKERARLARARDRALSEANTARAELKRASTKHADADGARWALESRATALQLELDAVLRAQADAAEAHRVEIDAHAKQLDELQEREVRCVTLRVCFLLPQIFLPAPSSHTIAPPLLSLSPSLTETRAGQGLRTQGEARAAGANDDAAPTTSPRRWVDPSWRRAAPRRPDVGGRAYHLSRWSADTRVGALARHRARLIEGR